MDNETIPKYPLRWPVGWRRTAPGSRKPSPFSKRKWVSYNNPQNPGSGYHAQQDLTIADAIGRLQGEMKRWGIPDWLISSNVQVRLDGLPYSNAGNPSDPGVAVYFRLRHGGKPKVFACDRFTTVAGNIAAIAGHIEALRAVERYSVGELERVFAGYNALPPSAEDWRVIFGFKPDEVPKFEIVDARYKLLMQQTHPDRNGGDPLQAARLNIARDAAREELTT